MLALRGDACVDLPKVKEMVETIWLMADDFATNFFGKAPPIMPRIRDITTALNAIRLMEQWLEKTGTSRTRAKAYGRHNPFTALVEFGRLLTSEAIDHYRKKPWTKEYLSELRKWRKHSQLKLTSLVTPIDSAVLSRGLRYEQISEPLKHFAGACQQLLAFETWTGDETFDGLQNMVHQSLDPILRLERSAGAVRAARQNERKPPLTRNEQYVLNIIKSHPNGIKGRTILGEMLRNHRVTVGQSDLTSRIIPKLKRWHGVKNRPGAGYYI
jgi:hypothetical protein